MLIGAMNHPGSDVLSEIAWMAQMGFDFVDLTLEPPAAASWRVEPRAIRDALDGYGLHAVGHTAYYLPLASPFEEIRQAAVVELRRCLDIFGALGVRWMNIHPDRNIPMHDRSFVVRRNLESISELLPLAERNGVGLMIENLPGDYNSVAQLGDLLGPLPELGLHLDIGHANLMSPMGNLEAILSAFCGRLRHVHLHDNRGGAPDLHLPLGAGSVDVFGAIAALKTCGYDGTITLEVFSPNRDYLSYSRDLLRRLWDDGGQRPRPS
jgi:sugar phosphate isomerase/epimerase